MTANDHSRIHNGHNYDKYLNAVRPAPPNDGSYEKGLIEAARIGSLNRVRYFLKFNVNVDYVDDVGYTALHWAASGGHQDVARALLEAHCHIDSHPKSNGYGTPLLHAIQAENASMARFLLLEGADPDASSKQLGTALHEACRSGNLEIVTSLLGAGVAVNVFRSIQRSDASLPGIACMPLFLAAGRGNADMVLRMLAAGADVNGLGAYSPRPFPKGHEKWKKVPKGLEDTVHLQRPIHVAAEFGHNMVLKTLIDGGAIVDSKSCDTLETTSLHCAALKGHANCVQVLLECGALPNERSTERSETPLHYAARSGSLECVNRLLDHGALVNETCTDGGTALLEAVSFGHVSCAELLIVRGANIAQKDGDGCTALFAAKDGPCVRLLARYGARLSDRSQQSDRPTPLLRHAWHGRRSAVEALLDLGVPVNEANDKGRTAYDFARSEGHERTVELLEQRGGKPGKGKGKRSFTSRALLGHWLGKHD